MFAQLAQGFVDIFQFWSLIAIGGGVLIGVLVGGLPGLTATMGVALITPMTFPLAPEIGIALLLGVYVGGIYGGSIPAILVRAPGTPAAIVTTFDGYPLAGQGRAGEALSMALFASATGGIISALVLIFVAPQLAQVAIRFGPAEYFGLTIFGMSVIAAVSGKSIVKGLIAGALGILISVVGMDPMTGVPRFTFGFTRMLAGLELIPVLIGVFAVSEVFVRVGDAPSASQRQLDTSGGLNYLNFRQAVGYWRDILRGGLIGSFVGIVPGTGGGIASFLAYGQAKRVSKTPEQFGEGSLEGLTTAESSNNATTGGALVPMLTLGVPGDPATAVLIGAFMIQGITPGPFVFEEHGSTIYALFAGFLIANVVLLVVGTLGRNLFAQIVRVPSTVLFPVILILCFVGSYAIRNSVLDVGVMVAMGFLGYLLRREGFPGGPLVIGVILGPLVETSLRRALTSSHGNPMIFLQSPIGVMFLILTVLSLSYPLLRKRLQR